MGDTEYRNDENVIIPDTGAAAYWYVDPRAYSSPSPIPQTPVIGSDQSYPEQERADIYDKLRYQGMEEPPTSDHELAEQTKTFEMDGLTYILPTKVDGTTLSDEDAIKRYKETGEHLGVFLTDKDADFFQTNYLHIGWAPTQDTSF